MKYRYQSIRGMHDFFLEEMQYLNYLEVNLKNILNSYSFSEIRFPILETSEIFEKIIGNNTEIVQKEMYNFLDRKKKKISLRPEGTASCIRACIQHNLFQNNVIQKLWYLGPMFRYERPQKGRFRQFHQLGIENFGISNIISDLELLKININIWKFFNIFDKVTLEINSIGSLKIRQKYALELKKFLKNYEHTFSISEKKLLFFNPIRLLDSKCKNVQNLITKGPCLTDFLEKKSKNRFKKLCFFLDHNNIPYIINLNLVRGLDYYNDTVFEWKTRFLGSQNTICAGGRYDNLVSILGGPKIPSIGCAIGMERLLLLCKTNVKYFISDISKIYLSIFCNNPVYNFFILKIAEKLRYLWPFLKINSDFSNFKFSKIIKTTILKKIKFLLIIEEKKFFYNKIIIKNLFTKIQYSVKLNRIFKKPCLFI
ncbi:histidine--tRNA ligase [Buchnera aphidicola]|uniref:histidine--tRNA ligase n=1 Tax=Buchnera aphidicola TaxID=9 RepID=UPI0031B6D74C